MPGPTLPNTGITLPALGSDSGTWDDENNACWQDYDAHDHTAGNGARIPTAGININADLSFGGFAGVHLGQISFDQIATLVTGATSLFVDAADHELYWRTAGGANVKLTAGASINTSLVGGILGDYTAVGAKFSYDDANKRYTAQDESSDWARIASADLQIYQQGTAESVFVGLSAPTALAASYNLMLPLVLPSAAVPLVSDASGNLSFTSTFGQTIDAPDFKNTTPVAVTIAAALADPNGNVRVPGAGGATKAWQFSGSDVTFSAAIPADATITGYAVNFVKTSNASVQLAARLYTVAANGTETSQGVGSTTNANNPGAVTITELLSVPLSAVKGFYLGTNGASGSDIVLSVVIDYTRGP